MKTPSHLPVTRMFPIGTAAYNSRWLATFLAGSSLMSSAAMALDNPWTGEADNNWNNAANWSDIHGFGKHVPVKGAPHPDDEDAVINTLTNFPVVTASTGPLPIPRDIKVGVGGGPGRLDITGGTAAAGGGNWAFVGTGGNGNGVLNIANTSASGGTLTNFGQGTGNFSSDRLYVGGIFGTGTGRLNINTTGTINTFNRVYLGHGVNGNGTINMDSGTFAIGNDLAIGTGGGVGVFNFSAGTITTGGWNFFGKDEEGANGDGTFNMSGGTLTNTGRQYVGSGNSVGRFNLSGGTFQNNGEFSVGSGNLANASASTFTMTGGTLNTGTISIGGEALNDAAAGKATGSISGASILNVTGELWVGQRPGSTGSLNIAGGTIGVANAITIGRNGGIGTVTMSGGSVTKTGVNNFAIGDGTSGTLNMTGGTVSVNNEFWVGQAAGGVGRMNISAGTVSGSSWMAVGRAGADGILTISGTGLVQKTIAGSFEIGNNAASIGVVNLDGGTLMVDEILTGGGSSTFNFNGGRLKAVASVGNFMQGLTNAYIKAGGALVDTNGFNVTLGQFLQEDVVSTGGGVTKTGAGNLTLSGSNIYPGLETVEAGTLFISTNAANATNVSVANGAGFGVLQSVPDALLNRNNITFGTTGPSQMNFNLGNFAGNTTVAPLNVTGTLTLNGNVTINIADQLPEVGNIPLISYTGPKAGAGAFVLAPNSLPNGVVGTLSDAGGLVSLNVTSVALPYWDGTIDNVWNTTTPNWINLVGGGSVAYQNGNPVLFDDNATGPGGANLLLNTTVTPASVTFNNSALFYSLSGTGKISGATSFAKQGTSTVSIGTLNDYTGVTTLTGGITQISTLTNGSTASSIGAATSAPANLVLNGGTLEYTGPATSTDRGFTLSGPNGGLSIQNDLTSNGVIANTAGGNLTKSGPGNLILTNPSYTIGTASPGLRAAGGTLTLAGGGTQTVSVGGDLWVGNVPDVPAALVLQSTTLNVGGWIALGRGNGSSGTLSSLTANNSTITSANHSTGFDNGLGGNDSDQTITLNNTNWTVSGLSLLSESANSTLNMTVSGTSHYKVNDRLQMGIGAGSVVNLTIENSGMVTKTGGWLAIGDSNTGVATVTVKDSGRLVSSNDFNIGDVGASSGTLNIQGSAVVTSAGTAFIGKSNGDGTGTAQGTLNLTSGTFEAAGWVTIGRYAGSTGTVNVSGGTFTQAGTTQGLIVGEEGTGTLNISGTGTVISAAPAVIISSNDNPDTIVGAGAGTINLNSGGTLVARRIIEAGANLGIGIFNFNGGLLRVGANPNADFMTGLDLANVLAGGANIDTNGNNIAITQALVDGGGAGGLTKTGAGTLQLNGFNTFTGTATVSAGTLSGTGSVAGALTVSTGATIAPGAAAPGTFAVGGAATLSGTYAVEIDGGINDTLSVAGTLNVSAATLAVTTLAGGASQPAYVIATYSGATPAPFAAVTGLPPGYAVNYAYNDGATSTNIAIVTAAPPAAYTTWISGFFAGETDPAIIGTAADPDKDGESNAVEFALGGQPNSGSNNAKIYTLAADSNGDADTTSELLLTIAVRTGAPAFTGSPAPSSALDGFTVSVEGGSLLSSFPTMVNPVGVVAAGLPAAPAGYEYRTFSLAGSNGLPGRGFLRARVAF